MSAPVDAAALYNAGTQALQRGDLGAAVTLLQAAKRVDPRAGDIRANLAIARARVEERSAARSPLALSASESWNASGALALLGALLLLVALSRARARRWVVAGAALFALGSLLGLGLFLRAREEARHPEAVVVAPMLDVLPAPDERPVSPYLLGAGEEVRMGAVKGDLVEVRVGGNPIGWVPRSGLWRVADAARYTAPSGSGSSQPPREIHR